MDQTENFRELKGEVTYEWKIKKFFPLLNKTDACYLSPMFHFSGTAWNIALYPNGLTKNETEGNIAAFICRKSTGSPVTLSFLLSIQTVDSKTYAKLENKEVFDQKALGYGGPIISRSYLIEKKLQLAASDDIIVICTLQNSKPNDISGSLFHRYQEIVENLERMYVNGQKTDILLKFDDHDHIYAHRIILETRSSVFSAMLSHDTKENKSGEVAIEDIDSNTMNDLLLYMYSGDINILTTNGALSLYNAAEKYDIKTVKEMCSEFIIRKLTVETVLDVIKFAELYDDESLCHYSREFFKENADKVLESANWETFVKENHNLSVDLLATVVKTLFKK